MMKGKIIIMTAAERKEKAKAAEAEKKALRAELVKIATSITAKPAEKLEAIRYIMKLDAKGAY
jgi:hypothetical protein